MTINGALQVRAVKILSELQESNFDFYLIGSRKLMERIGVSSDYDFIIKNSKEVRIFLHLLGFNIRHRRYTPRIRNSVLYEYKDLIDVILVQDDDDIKFLLECHNLILLNSDFRSFVSGNKRRRILFFNTLFAARNRESLRQTIYRMEDIK